MCNVLSGKISRQNSLNNEQTHIMKNKNVEQVLLRRRRVNKEGKGG
jgi:hypothetical protein